MSLKFSLYLVGPASIGPKERFYLITANYSLLYTNRRPPKGARRVDRLKNLPELAKTWLNGCIEQLRAEHLASKEAEILRRGREFNRAFESELAAEQAALNRAES